MLTLRVSVAVLDAMVLAGIILTITATDIQRVQVQQDESGRLALCAICDQDPERA